MSIESAFEKAVERVARQLANQYSLKAMEHAAELGQILGSVEVPIDEPLSNETRAAITTRARVLVSNAFAGLLSAAVLCNAEPNGDKT